MASVLINFRFSEHTKQRLREVAEFRHSNMTDVVVNLIDIEWYRIHKKLGENTRLNSSILLLEKQIDDLQSTLHQLCRKR